MSDLREKAAEALRPFAVLADLVEELPARYRRCKPPLATSAGKCYI